jgi:hypothetical protein
MGMIGGIFLIPLFVQTYLGYTVTKSGYLFIPMALGLMVAAQLGARLAARIPSQYIISVGMFWASFGIFLFSGIDIRWSFFDIAWRLTFFAFGLGLGLSSLTRAATSTVPISEVGIASSVLALARNISGAFGIAIFTSILTNSITSGFIALQTHSVINSHNPQIFQQVAGLMAIQANVVAYKVVFRVATVFMAVGGIAALFVKEGKRNAAESQQVHEVVEI